jgi:uncharacterized protein (DUF1697 family)
VICVALIRGINVGKTKRISMADLSAAFTTLQFENVRTLLNSGNVIFEAPRPSAPKLAAAIVEAIAGKFGFTVSVTVVTAPELKKIIDENPLLAVAKDPSRHFVAFAPNVAALAALQPLLQRVWKPDALAITRRAAYLWCEAGAIDSPLSKMFGRKAGDAVTLRNWATVLKIQTLASGGA